MSNPDWPGPYWQDDVGSGWRGRQNDLPQDRSPWDDNAGFWRGEERGSAHRGEPSQDRDRRRSSRHSANGSSGWDGRRSRAQEANGREPLTGRFSQTADDLRSRLGSLRASALNRGRSRGRDANADEDGWGEPGSRRRGADTQAGAGRRAYGSGSGRADWDGGATQAWNEPGTRRNGYRGARRAGTASTAFGERTGMTAVRDRTGWGSDFGRPGGGGPGRRGPHGGRGSGRGFKHWLLYGSWWRHWTWKKLIGVFFGGIAGFILLGMLAMFIAYEMTPMPTATALTANWQSSNVYFANGQLLGTFSNGINRQLLTSSEIPKAMTEAMTAAEDRGFYTEGGISVTGLMRSAFEDIFGSGGLQGGSTITMQYAKNYYANVDTGRNISTKLKEVFIAMKLAHEKTKSWIMTSYLNTVYFGDGASGVGAAAEAYFNKNLANPNTTLTVPQAAMLAAMVNEPSVFDPNPDGGAAHTALVQRYDYVLTNMVRDGSISQQAAAADENAFPKITPQTAASDLGYKGYLFDMVKQELLAPVSHGGYGLTLQDLYTKGYSITTTFSMARVNELARAVQAEQRAMKADGVPFPVYDRIGAVLENAKTGAIIAVYGGPGYSTNTKWCDKYSCFENMAEAPEPEGSSFKPYVLSSAVKQGMSVFTSKLNGYGNIWIPELPADTPTVQMKLSRLTPPPGLTNNTKPGGYSGGIYYYHFPEAAEPGFAKPLAPAVAAAESSDPAFEDLAHRDGIQNVLEMAKDFGVGQSPFVQDGGCFGEKGNTIQDNLTYCNDFTGVNGIQAMFSPTEHSAYWQAQGLPGSPQIALGEGPLTAVEQATTFATLADDGLYHTPHVIQSLKLNGIAQPSGLKTEQVLTQAQANDVDYALSFDNNSSWGTAEGSVPYDRGGLIAKTGTLGSGANSSQAWFIGAVPKQYALSIALFTNDPGRQNLDNLPAVGGNSGSVGGGWPATIWNEYMQSYFNKLPQTQVTTVFPPVNGSPFVPWIQVTAPKQQCGFGGGFGGNGNGNGNGHGQNCCTQVPGFGQICRGGGNPNPNPSPTCGQFGFGGQPCNTTSPGPTPTCGPGTGGGPCNSSPSPSPSVSPSSTLPPGNTGTGAAGASPPTAAAAAAALFVEEPPSVEAAAAALVAEEPTSVEAVGATRLTS